MLKLAVLLLLLSPLSALAVSDAQSFFMATAKVYNARLSKNVWLAKMKTHATPEELKPLEEALLAMKDDQLLSAVQKDRSTLAFVNLEGKTLATLKMNEEGKLTLNDLEYNLDAHPGFKAQYEYLKSVLQNDLADASLIKFHQNLAEGISRKTISRIETEASEDAKLVKTIIANFEIKRLDITCATTEDQLPAYLTKKYKSGKDSQIATKDGLFLVPRVSMSQLDEYDEPYEERIEAVLISPDHELKFTKPVKKKKGAPVAEAKDIRLFEVWANGALTKKSQLLSKDSKDAEVLRAKALIKCCQDPNKSCLERLR
ncbi:hypothetical protein D3C87_1097740 [compost metagenome]